MRRLIFVLGLAVCAAMAVPGLAQQTMGSAAMPSCPSGDPVVWVNTSTKVYHLQGDSYFGKTKHGAYLCKSAADAKNYRAAGSGNKSYSGAKSGTNMNTDANRPTTSSGAAPGTNMNPNSAASPMPSAMPSSSHHKHHKHKGMPASPEPAPAAT